MNTKLKVILEQRQPNILTEFLAVFRIRISFHADPDPDPGSQKCPYESGSRCGSGSKEVNTKKE